MAVLLQVHIGVMQGGVPVGRFVIRRNKGFVIRRKEKRPNSGRSSMLSRKTVLLSVIALVAGTLALPLAAIGSPAVSSLASANGVPLVPGDVLASVGNGLVDNYSASGTLNDTLDTSTAATYTTGGCFDTSGNFYVTDFDSDEISEFNSSGVLVNSDWASPSNTPESCTVAANGDVFVGGPGFNSGPIIYEYNSSGTQINSFDVTGGSGTGGTDWLDLEADQCTLLYTGEGSQILSYNTCTDTQNPDFVDGLPAPCFELRIRPDGDVMVACASEVLRFNSSGTLEQTYTIPDTGELFSMNLDPDNSTFWTGDDESGEVYHVDISSGSVISSFNSSPPVGLYGLTLVGSINVSQPTVTLAPMTQTLNTGQTATVTATITNPGGSISGQTVNFAVTGANTASGSGVTNASGQTTFSYVGTNVGVDLITASYSGATGTASVTWTNSTCDSGPWPTQLNGVPKLGVGGEAEGFYIGVNPKTDRWTLEVTHTYPPIHVPIRFTGTITTDGMITKADAIMLERGDSYSVSGNQQTLTFDFRDLGHIDGVSFKPMCGSTITLQLNIQGVSAPTHRIHLGVPSTNPSTNPVTFTRTS